MSTSSTQRQINVPIPFYGPSSTGITVLNGISLPFSEIDKLIILMTKVNTGTAGSYFYFSSFKETGLYKVPSGKTLKIFVVYSPSGSYTGMQTDGSMIFGYAETPFNTTSYDQSTAPTGDVVHFGTSSTDYDNNVYSPTFLNAIIPANRYPFLRHQNAWGYFNGVMLGIEE